MQNVNLLDRKEARRMRESLDLASLPYRHPMELTRLIHSIKASKSAEITDESFNNFVTNQLKIHSFQEGIDYSKIPPDSQLAYVSRMYSCDFDHLEWRHPQDLAFILIDTARHFNLMPSLLAWISKLEEEKVRMREEYKFIFAS